MIQQDLPDRFGGTEEEEEEEQGVRLFCRYMLSVHIVRGALP